MAGERTGEREESVVDPSCIDVGGQELVWLSVSAFVYVFSEMYSWAHLTLEQD